MKNYLIYLKKNPLKALWLFIIILFSSVLAYLMIDSKDIIISDNSELIYYGSCVFTVIIILVAFYQPYKEYKDDL